MTAVTRRQAENAQYFFFSLQRQIETIRGRHGVGIASRHLAIGHHPVDSPHLAHVTDNRPLRIGSQTGWRLNEQGHVQAERSAEMLDGDIADHVDTADGRQAACQPVEYLRFALAIADQAGVTRQARRQRADDQ